MVQAVADLPSGGDIIEIDPYESADAYCGDLIEKISPKLGLAPLAKTNAGPEQFQFRLWTNLCGLADPKLLDVRSGGKENSAVFFNINRRADAIKSPGQRLASPKSGWNKMLFEMRNRLTTPKGLVRDPNFDLDRDESVILLEVLDKGDYRRILYGQKTTFPDGKRLIDTCKYVASEFNIEMNCGN
ncbi:MAG: hypothetical protein IT174_14560 [Acidobacteria bacterium]|nr:hypothetical protein [Acidobacteriota bacterium]